MTTQTKDNPPSSTQVIYNAVLELHALGKEATRSRVAELTGLKLTIVDDRLRALVNEERTLTRSSRGVYEPVPHFPPPRAMSISILFDHRVKLELGDDILTLTPEEARRVARGLGGFADDARVLETTRAHLAAITEISAHAKAEKEDARQLKMQIELMRKEIRALKKDKRKKEQQQAGFWDD